MKRTVVFYRTSAGCPFEEFLDSLPGIIAKKITWLLSAVQDLDSVSDLRFKEINPREDIWESRVAFRDAVFRILCFFHKRQLVVLWGGILMKFQSLLDEQEQRALKYKHDFLLREGKD